MLLQNRLVAPADRGVELGNQPAAHLQCDLEYAIFHNCFERQGAGITEKPQRFQPQSRSGVGVSRAKDVASPKW